VGVVLATGKVDGGEAVSERIWTPQKQEASTSVVGLGVNNEIVVLQIAYPALDSKMTAGLTLDTARRVALDLAAKIEEATANQLKNRMNAPINGELGIA
jgi:hypothetical protein